MPESNVLDRMRHDWNARALEDPHYYVAFGRREQEEAEFFSTELTARKLHLGAVVLNKVLPEYLRDVKTDKLA